MAYPTTISFLPISPDLGIQPIGSTSATQNHNLGHVVRAYDATYGEAEFIYLKGVASTAAGDLVAYDTKNATTVRAVHAGATSKGPCAVAMSANVATQYGWYCISGSVPVNSGAVAAHSRPYLTATAGQIDDAVVAGDAIDGALIEEVDSGGFATVQLSRPSINGNG